MKVLPPSPSAARRIASPVGGLVLITSETGLCGLVFAHRAEGLTLPSDDPGDPYLGAAEQQLNEYFSGRRKRFELPLAAQGTAFQRRVWQELSEIPFGETRSYGDIAKAIGQPNAVRAVGLANGSNPISIIVPCHRVIGANGSLTGFGGGLEIKQLLLQHEGCLLIGT